MSDRKQILVTGGAGYIGSAVVKTLIDAGHQVVVFDDLSTGNKDVVHEQATFTEGNVLVQTELDAAFEAHDFDVVIHCAAKKVMAESEADPSKYFKTNVSGTINVLDAMTRFNVPKIIFSSTAAVYAVTDDDKPVTEEALATPASVYGSSKLMAETLIQEYARLGKIQSYVILRYFTVAGDIGIRYFEKDSGFVFPLIANAIKSGNTFNVTGTDYPTRDGSGVRDYIHLADLAKGHIQALEYADSGIFNLGTSNGCTVRELIATFEEVSGHSLKVDEAPRRPGDVAVMLADAHKANSILGWQPTMTLRDMVSSTLDTYWPELKQQ